VRGRKVIRQDFVPTLVSGTGQPSLVTGWRSVLARQNFDGLRRCAGLSPVLDAP
jgi:hypothetical protein